jgi:hypothetical protein
VQWSVATVGVFLVALAKGIELVAGIALHKSAHTGKVSPVLARWSLSN